MPKKRWRAAVIAAAAAAVVAAAVALPLFEPWRLFTDKVVDEALPSAVPISTQSSSTTPPTVSAARTSAGPAKLLIGKLIAHEHETSGTVVVLQLADGSRVLRLENLHTSDGPDLKVWLSDAAVVSGRAGWHVFDDGRYVSLGSLKGNHGNQNYPIPASVKLSDFGSVAIWCDRFNVSFGAAELKTA
jgi:electron transfer DM13